MRSASVLAFIWYYGLALALLYTALAALLAIYNLKGEALQFAFIALLFSFTSVAARLGLARQKPTLSYPLKVLFYVSAWPVIALGATYATSCLSGQDGYQSFFFALAALTTTTSLPFSGTEGAEPLWIWHSFLAWCGGLLTITGSLSFASEWQRATSEGRPLLLGQRDWKQNGDDGEGRQFILKERRLLKQAALFYVTLTLVAISLITWGTSDLSLGSLIVFNGLSTTGFHGLQALMPAGGFYSLGLVCALLALAGSFQPVVYMLDGVRLRDVLTYRHFLIWFLPLTLFFWVLLLSLIQGQPPLSAFVTTVGLLSTTGLTLAESDLTSVPLGLILLMLSLGGFAYSTTGGIKIERIVLLFIYTRRMLLQGVYPHALVGVFRQTDKVTRLNYVNFRTLFILFMGVWLLGAVIFAIHLPVDASMVLSMAALTNAGDVYITLASFNGWPTLPDLMETYVVFLSIMMILGRLELVLALVAVVRLFSRLSRG